MRLLPLVAGFAVLLAFTNHIDAQQPNQHLVVPLKKFSVDQRFETVSGDPAKAGALYVIRIHAEAGYIIMPHMHPEDENIVVVKGSWALGMGDRYNPQALEPFGTRHLRTAAQENGALRLVQDRHDRPGARNGALYNAMGRAHL